MVLEHNQPEGSSVVVSFVFHHCDGSSTGDIKGLWDEDENDLAYFLTCGTAGIHAKAFAFASTRRT